MRIMLMTHHHESSHQIGAQRIHHFAAHLAELGHDVRTVYGRVAPSELADAESTSLARHGTLRLIRRAVGAVLDFIAVPDRQVLQVRALAAAGKSTADWRPDVVVASGPPFSVFIAARISASHHGVPWVADYRDLWSLSTYYKHGRLRAFVDRRIERATVKSVAIAISVSAPLASDLRSAFGIPSDVVLNGFDDSLQVPSAISPARGLPLSLVYTGELYPGKRDPAPLFRAVRQLGLTEQEIRISFLGSSSELVRAAAEAEGLGGIVHISPRVSQNAARAAQLEADVLLLLMWNSPGEIGVYSGKIFEYLYVGRPLLMLGYESGVAAELIRSRSAGVVANDPTEIGRHLLNWIDIKRTAGSIPGLPVMTSIGLSRRDAAGRLSELLNEIVGEAGARV